MYNDYFGFWESPFENNLNQRFLFLSEDHKEVLAALLYFIQENKAVAILCGDVGTGKTMLINCFLSRLPDFYLPIIISNPSVEYREILLYVARALEVVEEGKSFLYLIDKVKEGLIESQKQGKYYFLVIDEAHLLSNQSLDDIRLLSNIETLERKLLPILLVGQYELSHKLRNPAMRQLRQRISVNRFLSSLDYDETYRYIEHRLKLVGSSFTSCFTPNCLSLIYQFSDGVPRQINQICDHALLIAKTEGIKQVNPKIIKKAYNALQSDLIFTPQGYNERWSAVLKKIFFLLAGVSIIGLLFLGWFNYYNQGRKYPPPQLVLRPPITSPNPPNISISTLDLVPSQTSSTSTSEVTPSTSFEELTEEQKSTSPGSESPAESTGMEVIEDKKVVVQFGDTLTKIASLHYPHRVPLGIKEIIKANPEITDQNLIYPGQVLSLPASIPTLASLTETDKETTAKFAVKICTLLNSSQLFAEAYVTELKQKGYPAYLIPVKTEQGKIIYEIYTGNYLTREEAEAIANNFGKNEEKPKIIVNPKIETKREISIKEKNKEIEKK